MKTPQAGVTNHSALPEPARPAAGKSTRSDGLPASGRAEPVQLTPGFTAVAHEDPFGAHLLGEQVQMRGKDVGTSDHVHAAAAHGIAGSGGALPFLDQIQASFGPAHDVSHVQAHVGGAAAEASSAMGALAYATGDHVAFASGPDLHTAAHEAAHVVQQRGGVQLSGGVGAAGDTYERHADKVADAVVRGESAATLLASHGGGADAVQRSAVQRFAEEEHKKIGDNATGAETVSIGGHMNVSFGDMVAMAGDHFESIDEMKRLAKKPGPGEGTVEELEYVLTVKVRREKDRAREFSQSAREAADRRFTLLAGNNMVHFPNADVGDAEKHPAARAVDGIRFPKGLALEGDVDTIVQSVLAAVGHPPLLPRLRNAAAGYRYYHVRALIEAAMAGAGNHDQFVATGLGHDTKEEAARTNARDLSEPMATEAFGNHFMTDMFSSGHVRTERGSIKDYWNAKVPMFFYNLKGNIAEQNALRSPEEVAGIDLDPDTKYDPPLVDGAFDQVSALLDATGGLGWGDVVSGVVHDHDSAVGVKVTSDGQSATLLGDDHLGEGGEEVLATEAVRRSRGEVARAFEIGKSMNLYDPRLPVVPASFLHGELFAAERMIPRAKPDAEQGPGQAKLTWQRDSVDELLADAAFRGPLAEFCKAKAGHISSAAKSLAARHQKALAEGVVAPLKANPLATLRTVIDWVPTLSLELTSAYTEEAKRTRGGMASLTLEQRRKLITAHIAGSRLGHSPIPHGSPIKEIWTSAPPEDKQALLDEFGAMRLMANEQAQ